MKFKTNPDDLINQEVDTQFKEQHLTKREHFAAMAMQGFVLHYSGYVNCNFEVTPRDTAKRAVDYADALIEELNKQEAEK